MLKEVAAPRPRSAFVRGLPSKDLQPASTRAVSLLPANNDRHVLGGTALGATAWQEGPDENQLPKERDKDRLPQPSWQQSDDLQEYQAALRSQSATNKATSLKLELDAWHLPPAIVQASHKL